MTPPAGHERSPRCVRVRKAGSGSRLFGLWFFLLAGLGAVVLSGAPAERNAPELAREIMTASGVQGGLVVHLGCGDGRLTAALRVNDSYQVHGLDRDAANVEKARRHIRSTGQYGEVSVDRLRGDQLPYIENLVNLIVAEDLSGISMDEVNRVLAPRGVVYVKQGNSWSKTVKPWPKEIDEWTHYFHDASGNAVAHDTRVAPPNRQQWVGTPRWSRHHDRMASMSALVSARGRLFYIMDEGSRISIELPPKWNLIARDGFNGTILWKRALPDWQSHLWPLKSGPTHLTRRLVAMDEVVYVTLGYEQPVTALDAATGKTLRTFEGSKSTEEMILAQGVLHTLVNRGEMELKHFNPLFNTGDQGRVAKEFHWNEKPREVVAFEAGTGRLLWKKETKVAPLTLTSDGERAFFHDGEKVVCLNGRTGAPVWNSPPVPRRAAMTFNFGPRLVVQQGVLVFAGGERTMQAFDAKTGKELWSGPHAKGAYLSPEDLLVAGGLVWSAPTTSGKDSGIWTGLDLFTGAAKNSFPPNLDTYWFHHRCYIAKATDHYLLASRTGVEFIDYNKKNWDIHHWVRGGCLYGVMPCNGLTYTPPHNCACYPEAKLYGFNALAAPGNSRTLAKTPPAKNDPTRFERGPAYDQPVPPLGAAGKNSGDWPTFRHDASRSGFTKATVSADVKPSWATELKGRLSSLVAVGDKVFVAKIDEHAVVALDANSGRQLWTFTTGGRVNSPPTIYQGRALFGSADGWVYCVRASDGALIWRFRAAPQDLRLGSYEQLESVWPVDGSVLEQNGLIYCVAGRSIFLDGGLHFYLLDAKTGEVRSETGMDDRDPESGKSIQTRIQTLQMPVGLPDILASDGSYVYMKSQKFDLDGNRQQVGPNSGDTVAQVSDQRGDGVHLFAATGFLEEAWFHRTYWVFGKAFAGGHNGYYQAAKFAPAGNILVFDDKMVYSFGRKPEYLKWTTTMERHLFATSKEAPEPKVPAVDRKGQPTAAAPTGTSTIRFEKSKTLDPTGKPLAVEAWVKADKPDGVVLAHGGPVQGYALVLRDGKPQFTVRMGGTISSVTAKESVGSQWAHLVGALTAGKQLQIYVNGQLSATASAPGLFESEPKQNLEIGADNGGAVGDYDSPFGFTGSIDEVRMCHGALTAADVQARCSNPAAPPSQGTTLVLACSFDKGDASDASGKKNDGTVAGARAGQGKIGGAMQFTAGPAGARVAGKAGKAGKVAGKAANRQVKSLIQDQWSQEPPIIIRAMVLAGQTLFVAGPPDIVDEEEAFKKLTEGDAAIKAKLAEQDAALNGQRGGLLWVYSAKDGTKLKEYRLDSPPAWDGMVAAHGRVYLSTMNGKVLCFAAP